jgi:hypothetical protein
VSQTAAATTAENAYRAMQDTAQAWALNKFAKKLSNRIPDGAPTEDHEDVINVIQELREEANQYKLQAAFHRRANTDPATESQTPAYDALLRLYGPDPAPELITAIAHRDAEVLRTAADKLDALPPGGEALKGPLWYREGVHDAAGLCRDWADQADHADGFLGPTLLAASDVLAIGWKVHHHRKRSHERRELKALFERPSFGEGSQ